MKHSIVKKAFVAASVLSVLGYVGSASAHEQLGALGAGAKKTDYYEVSCFNDGTGDAGHLAVLITDLVPAASPLVSVQVIKGQLAKNTTDPVDGDATSSPEMKVIGGNGAYKVIVDKTGADAENYSLDYHCETSTGDHTGTSIVQIHDM
jgi:hypothetical protein